MRKVATLSCALLLASVLQAQMGFCQPTVPPEFQVTLLATGLNQPKGITSALFNAGAGKFGDDLYVAESGADMIQTVKKDGSGATPFAAVGDFPVGVNFFGGPFGKFLFVGSAFGGGIESVDPAGAVVSFALAGEGIAGLDFGRGPFGNDMYAGRWQAGEIWRVDEDGIATLFASVAGTQTRYLKFSHGGAFDTFLYFTDFLSGDIYSVDADGVATVFANTGASCLEGLDFSRGGAFGRFLYVGDLCSGTIYKVAADGTVTVWATGFGGVADIHFQPGGRGGFTMYLVDGQNPGSVYAISKM